MATSNARLRITAEDKSARAFNTATRNVDRLRATAKLAAGAVSAALVVRGIQGFSRAINRNLQAVDALAKSAQNLGTSVQGLQALQLAAEESGVAFSTVQNALNRFERSVGDAVNGTGRAREAFQQLGTSAQELSTLAPDEAFVRLATEISNIENVFERASIAQRIFGQEAKNLNVLFNNADGIRDAARFIDELQLGISQIDAGAVERTNDIFGRLSLAIGGIGQSLAVEVAPVLGVIGQRFIDAARNAGGFGNVFAGAVESTANFLGAFERVGDSISLAFLRSQRSAVQTRVAIIEFSQGIGEAFANIPEFIISVFRTAFNFILDKGRETIQGIAGIFRGELPDINFDINLPELEIRSTAEDLRQANIELVNFNSQIRDLERGTGFFEGLNADAQKFRDDIAASLEAVGNIQSNANVDLRLNNVGEQADQAKAMIDAALRERFEAVGISLPVNVTLDEGNNRLEDRLNELRRSLQSEEQIRAESLQRNLEQLSLAGDQEIATQREIFDLRRQLIQDAVSEIAAIELPNTGDTQASGNAGSIFDLIPGLAGGDQANRLQEELNTLQDAFDQRLELIRAFSDQLSQLGIDSATLEVETEAQRQRELSRIEQRGIQERRRQRIQDINNKLSAARDFARAIITITDNQSKTLFRIQQAASIAIAVVNTAEAVTEVLPDFGRAAAVAAAGAAEIATIASASIGGSSGGNSRGVIGSSGGGFGGNEDTDGFIDPNPASPANQQTFNIVLEGSGYTQDDIRNLLEELNEATGDGTTFRPTFT